MTFLNLGCGKRRSTRTIIVLAILLAMTLPTRSLRLARCEAGGVWVAAGDGVVVSAIVRIKPPYCAKRRYGFQCAQRRDAACAIALAFRVARWPAAGAG